MKIVLLGTRAGINGVVREQSSAQREQSNRLATTLAEAPQIGPRVAAHGGWATFHPTKDDRGNLFHTLVIHLSGLQRRSIPAFFPLSAPSRTTKGASFRHPCRRGAFHLVEKHRKAHPRPHVMAAYLGSHEKFRSLYKKLAE